MNDCVTPCPRHVYNAQPGVSGDSTVALEHMDAMAHADVLHLGGGAFSELAASLNTRAVKLAPGHVWASMPFTVDNIVNTTYPAGKLQPGGREAMVTALRLKQRNALEPKAHPSEEDALEAQAHPSEEDALEAQAHGSKDSTCYQKELSQISPS
eukprot:4439676-Pleurochrysis_carterae.AAC.2